VNVFSISHRGERSRIFQGDEVLFGSVWHLFTTLGIVVLSDQFRGPVLTESCLAFKFDFVLFYSLCGLIFIMTTLIFIFPLRKNRVLLPFIPVFQYLFEFGSL
jgi:hypothetical protein